RENRPQGCFEGLTPVQVRIVVQELVACDSEVQEALADPLEVIQEMTQARPHAFHRVAVHTRTVRVTTRILTCAMVDRPMVVVGLGEMVDVVCIGEELRPDFHLGGGVYPSWGRDGIAGEMRYALGGIRHVLQKRSLPDAMPDGQHTSG